MNANNNLFLSYAISNLIKNKITVRFVNTKNLSIGNDKQKIGGYFSDADKELAVATGLPFKKWFPIFIHEYCHFLQYKTKVKIYKDLSAEILLTVERWVASGIKEPNTVSSIKKVQMMELDCEKRAAKLITEFNLSLDIETYIKSANAYIFFYTLLCEDNRWTSKKGPYSVKQIIDIMPDEFLKSYDTLPKGYKEYVRKFCY